jgi:hypothetical protein
MRSACRVSRHEKGRDSSGAGMSPGLGSGPDVLEHQIPVRPRLLADWSEFEVHMKKSPSVGQDRRRRAAGAAASDSFVADGEAAHGRA